MDSLRQVFNSVNEDDHHLPERESPMESTLLPDYLLQIYQISYHSAATHPLYIPWVSYSLAPSLADAYIDQSLH
jgi:hypothetical protein